MNGASENAKVWRPDRFTAGYNADPTAESDYSMIVLNVPIRHNTALFSKIWTGALTKICADGGANTVWDLRLGKQGLAEELYPDVVVGDLDSIRPPVLEHYKAGGVRIVQDESQYSTDLGKSLAFLGQKHEKPIHIESRDVAIYGGLEGRVDQALSQLHQLYVSSTTKGPGIKDIYLLTTTSVVMLLEKGKNEVHAPVSRGSFTVYAGIVPLAGPVTLTTRGFEWDLDGDELAFGRFVSTSNHLVEDMVEIETSAPVILTLEMDLS